MTFPSVGGGWGCQYGEAEYSADGETSGLCLTNGGATNFNSIGPFSGIHLTDFQGPLVDMFLANTLPTTAPAALRFYASNSADGGVKTNFLTLSPQLGQVFFIGDGLTGTGTGSIQTFIVPAAATHLYLGYLDNCAPPGNTVPSCYSDNVGSLSATALLQYYIPDWVEPTLSTAPSARGGASMAYDAAGYYALLFGGGTFGAPDDDTWVWLYGWYQLSPATSPSARGFAGSRAIWWGRPERKQVQRHVDLGRSYLDPAVPVGLAAAAQSHERRDGV